jgi:hypothetical protein
VPIAFPYYGRSPSGAHLAGCPQRFHQAVPFHLAHHPALHPSADAPHAPAPYVSNESKARRVDLGEESGGEPPPFPDSIPQADLDLHERLLTSDRSYREPPGIDLIGLPENEIKSFYGALYPVFFLDSLPQRSCPGFHIAVGCGLLYGASQPLDRE